MENLNFNKAMVALLSLTMMAGCSSSSPVSKAPAPVDNVSVLPPAGVKTFDLGAKDGGSFRANFRFADKQKFRLKNDFPTNTSSFPLNGFVLNIKLYRTTVGGSGLTPKARYETANTTGSSDVGNVFSFSINDPAASNTVTFKGLQEGFDYYISARIYTPWYDLSPSNIAVNVAGTNVSNSSKNLSGLVLYATDLVKINGGTSNVVNPPAAQNFDSFSVFPAIAAGTSVSFTNFARNVVGIGNIGDTTISGLGMASDTGQAGGGTAPAYTGYAAGGSSEEYVHFNGSSINIANDDTPGANPATPNFTWDMEINLMESLGADVNGNVSVNLGDLGPAEKIQ